MRVVAQFGYQAEEEGELSFREGDVIEVLERDSSGWHLGSLGGRQGTYPANYCKEEEEEEEGEREGQRGYGAPPPMRVAPMRGSVGEAVRGASLSSGAPRKQVSFSSPCIPGLSPRRRGEGLMRTLRDYAGDPSEHELSFSQGELIRVLQRDEESGWWRGELLSSGEKGWFSPSLASPCGDDGVEHAGAYEELEDLVHVQPVDVLPLHIHMAEAEGETGDVEPEAENADFGYVRATHDHRGDPAEHELTYCAGDILEVVTKDPGGWYKCRSRTLCKGWASAHYLEPVPNSEALPPKPLAEWSMTETLNHFATLGASQKSLDLIEEEGISGLALCGLEKKELRSELGLSLGVLGKFYALAAELPAKK